MNTLETIRSRHSYRGKYKSTPVPREDLITIMWANERFDPAHPDTYRLPVAPERKDNQ